MPAPTTDITRADLAGVIGWRREGRRQALLVRLALVVLALVVLRVAWLGSNYLLTATVLSESATRFSINDWARSLQWPVALVTTVILIELLWLASPHRLSREQAAPIPTDIGRRTVLGAVAGGVALMLAGGFALRSAVENAWNETLAATRRRALFYTKRKSTLSDVFSPALAPGWYQNLARRRRIWSIAIVVPIAAEG